MSVALVSLEEMVLLSLQSVKSHRGTVTGIRNDLKGIGLLVTGGAVDRTLRRLEKKGLVSSALTGEARKVRYWVLAGEAVSALERAEKARCAMRERNLKPVA